MSHQHILVLSHASIGYNVSRRGVLADVSLELARDEIVGITGTTGSGKTTLLKALAGLLPLESGELTWSKGASRPRLCYSPQTDILLPYRTVWENAGLLLERATVPREKRASALGSLQEGLRLLNLDTRRDEMPSFLSGGMRQRVQVAQALFCPSDVVLLDEPFAQQDRDNQGVLESLVYQNARRERRAMVVVSHDVDVLAAVCDRTIFLGGQPSRVSSIAECSAELRALPPAERKQHEAFPKHNAALWSERAQASLL